MHTSGKALLVGFACISHLIQGSSGAACLLFSPSPSPANRGLFTLTVSPQLGLQGRGFHSTQLLLARGGKADGKMPNGVKKENLPSKMCVTCNRPFTW